MATLPWFVVALVLGACSEDFAGDGTTDGGTGDGGAGDGGGGGGDGGVGGGSLTGELPPVDEDLDQGGCEDVSGTALPGAAVYFLGAYVDGDDGWEGREEVRVFANDTWAAGGGADCSVVWVLSASEADAGACGNCDLGLSVSAQLDLSATTCAKDLYEGEESWASSYAVDLTEDTTVSTWYYAETGTWLGAGYALGTAEAPTALNYASEKTCWWF